MSTVSTIKLTVVKCLAALALSMVMVASLVAFAAAESKMKVTIIEGETKTKMSTYCTTAEEIVADAGIVLNAGDKVSLNQKAGANELVIERAFPVYVTVGDETVMLKMCKGTVAKALELADIELGKNDICNLKQDTVLTKESYIDIVVVDYVTVSYEETIPYTTKVVYSSSLAKGEEKVIDGVNGVKNVTVKQKIENGVVVGSEVVSTKVTKEPIAKKTIIGTKKKAVAVSKPVSSNKKNKANVLKNTISTLSVPTSLKLDSRGIPTSYKKVMTFEATAYTDSSGNKCSTGVTPQTGYIAVNPNIIPYGTKMYIVSKDGRYVYGYAIAADTGGFAKKRPYNVDLFFNTKSECRNFGRRDVTIYFL